LVFQSEDQPVYRWFIPPGRPAAVINRWSFQALAADFSMAVFQGQAAVTTDDFWFGEKALAVMAQASAGYIRGFFTDQALGR